ncbi:hypothetical protein DNTS_003249 [Danionella cerebrum]|uniref:Fork-head domain-containing protein n=1 Tax=Danionella cerebrum TaxID=2873325 RepID=A0A553RIU0_9TELE|nr:hypothetical protein DNTS_003249 [Danionella translucida]
MHVFSSTPMFGELIRDVVGAVVMVTFATDVLCQSCQGVELRSPRAGRFGTQFPLATPRFNLSLIKSAQEASGSFTSTGLVYFGRITVVLRFETDTQMQGTGKENLDVKRALYTESYNSIRHNLSLHTRFIRVQNEGTGKSSWWMLNPEGGKMGKGPRRRALSMDNGTKYLKSRGRVSRKRAGTVGICRELVAPGIQGSPEHGSPAGKTVMAVGNEEFDAWTDLHSRTSSSASTLSGCLSPILAETEPDEPEEGGISCSASPQLYPSPTSTRSPALATGGHCPSVELPHLADLTGAISLKDSYSQHLPLNRNGYHYGNGPKEESSYCGAYGQPPMSILRHHMPMQTIQENKPSTFQRALRAYSENNALESLLADGPQYCGKDLALNQGGESHTLLSQTNSAVHSHSQNHNRNPNQNLHRAIHEQAPSHHPNPSHNKHHSSLDYNQMHNHLQHSNPRQPELSQRLNNDILQTYNHKSHSLYGCRANLPSTSLPPNPAMDLDVPQDPCHLASAPHPRHQSYPGSHLHQAISETWQGYYHHTSQNSTYHGNPHQDPRERIQSELEMDVHHSSLECDVESILLNDFMDSTEGMDYNFDGSLSQGVGMGMGLGIGIVCTHHLQFITSITFWVEALKHFTWPSILMLYRPPHNLGGVKWSTGLGLMYANDFVILPEEKK